MPPFLGVGSTILVGYALYKFVNNYTNRTYPNSIDLTKHLKSMNGKQEFYDHHDEMLTDRVNDRITFSPQDLQLKIYGISVNQFVPIVNIICKVLQYRGKSIDSVISHDDKLLQQPPKWSFDYIIQPFRGFSISDAFTVMSLLNILVNPGYEALSWFLANGVSQLMMLKLQPFVDNVIPIDAKYYQLSILVLMFFKRRADELEKQYNMWVETKDPKYYNKAFEPFNMSDANRYFSFFTVAVMTCLDGTNFTKTSLKSLMDFIADWYNKQSQIPNHSSKL